jgi:hypothetical protein
MVDLLTNAIEAAVRLTARASSGRTASTGDREVIAEPGVAAVAQPVAAGPGRARRAGELTALVLADAGDST